MSGPMTTLERVARGYGAFFTADELLDTDVPEPRWAVHGLIPEGLSLLAGAPKLGKSWLALGLGIAVASGAQALGQIDTTAGDVLYAALEDTPRRLKRRLNMMLGQGGAPSKLTLVTMLPEMPRAIELIAEWLDAHPDARLVVIDVLGKIRPPSGSSSDKYENDYKVIGALKRLADDHQIAIVAVTHTRKMADEDVFATVAGSTGLTGAADTTIVLRRPRGEAGALLNITGRDVEESEYALTFDPQAGTWTLDGTALAEAAQRAVELKVTASLGDDAAAVVKYVLGRNDGTRAADVTRDLGLSAETARKYLKRAADSARIRQLSRGLYGGVPSVPSVPTGKEVGHRRDGRDGWDTTCRGCGEVLDPTLGEETHPTCEAVA